MSLLLRGSAAQRHREVGGVVDVKGRIDMYAAAPPPSPIRMKPVRRGRFSMRGGKMRGMGGRK
jgi:hypothetical protein